MRFIQISVKTTREAEELVAEIMWEIGSGGVSIYDSNDVAELFRSSIVWDYIDENLLVKSEVVTVCGFFPYAEKDEAKDKLDKGLDALRRNSDFALGSLEVTESECDDQDWLVTWKSFYSPLTCGKVRVLPCWITEENQYPAVVKIDPGTAFGTGEHETTQLMLEGLSEYVNERSTVLDVGTGSGILAIAAKKLGADKVYGYDIDPMAVSNALENARINDVDKDILLTADDLLSVSDIKADIVVANITADILEMLSTGIKAHIKTGGILMLSGIIHKKLDEVRGVYSALGFVEVEHKAKGEWNRLIYKYLG